MRISDWSSDVCSSDLSSSTESSGTATLRIPNSKTSANLTTRNRIANFSPGSTARSKKRPPNSPNPHKEYRNELVSPQMESRNHEIGRATSRERMCHDVLNQVVAGTFKTKRHNK